jgi:outer membrane protein assembly factor BamB
LILAPCTDNNLYAINQQGLLQWTFSESKQPLWAQPVTNGDLVYQGSMDHSLYAINLSSGNLAWKVDLDGAVVYAPLLEDGVLYIPTLADTLYAVDTSTQRVLWQFKTDEEVWGVPVIQDGILYFADLSGQIYALDAQSGRLAWRVDAGGSVAGSAGMTSEGLVFLTETGDVLLVNFEGVKQWTRSIDGQLYGTPTVGEDRIVVPVVGGEELLVTYDFRGNQVWTFVPPK